MLIFTVLLTSCGSTADELAETVYYELTQTRAAKPTESQTATATDTFTATLTATPTLTSTSTITPTSTNTLTPSSTPTPEPEVVVSTNRAILRSGPGESFSKLTTLNKGKVLVVLGRNQDSSWLAVKHSYSQIGWISLDLVESTLNIEGLSEIESPPTPTSTIHTITITNLINTSQLEIMIVGHGVYFLNPNETFSSQIKGANYKFAFCHLNTGESGRCSLYYYFDYSVLSNITWRVGISGDSFTGLP